MNVQAVRLTSGMANAGYGVSRCSRCSSPGACGPPS